MPAAQAANPSEAQPESKVVRLHITPFRPDLLKVYVAPSILPFAQNISYHTVATFPEKGFGYVELPETEAQKIKKKLNGTTLRGSKVRIEMAKPEKRKALVEADAVEVEDAERSSKRAKKEKKEKKENTEKKKKKGKEQGVLDGVELPDDRKVKRGWTEPAPRNKKDRKDKKDKGDKEARKEAKKERKHSKYTKEPEVLFKAKLTPVAATEVAHKDEKKGKKEKKEKNKSSREVVIHEFEKNHKTPSFLKQPEVALSTKPAVDYVNGQGWVDEDGVVVEPETGKAKARRALELVDAPSEAARAWIDGTAKSSASTSTDQKKKKATSPPSSSESEDDESSVVSSSSEDEDSSDSESEESESEAVSSASSPVPVAESRKTSEEAQPTTSSEKEVHPLEALFKRAKPADGATSTPTKKLTPIDTSFSFFDNEEPMEVDGEPTDEAPTTPFTQRDIEWRGLRSAAPTPDTAAIGRRFSFDWRKNSQEADDDEDMGDVDSLAEQRLSHNTRANASKLAGVTEEDEDDAVTGADEEKPESEFRKWFWENRGDLNRAWKKRRRDALKAKRHSENRKMTGGRRV
jgi:hypothetical protein